MSTTSRKNGIVACGFNFKHKNTEIIYTVIDSNTLTPIGVFNNLDTAKESGKITTNNQFSILQFYLNEQCNYNSNIIYQSY